MEERLTAQREEEEAEDEEASENSGGPYGGKNYQRLTEMRAVEEAVFLQSHIPTSLAEINNPHLELRRLEAGQREGAFAAAVEGMLGKEGGKGSDKRTMRVDTEDLADGEMQSELGSSDDDNDDDNVDSESNDDDSDDGSEDSEDGGGRRFPQASAEDTIAEKQRAKELRKENKRLVKEAAATRRLTKIPKHVKKRAIKAGKKK